MGFGVYIHFPYCLSKCPYCDFASKAVRQVPSERYGRAVAAELQMRRAVAEGRRALSLYVGGGTPSLWAPESLEQVLDAVRSAVAFEEDAEQTLEANPGASDAARFAAYRRLGLNRLSIGVQSFHAESLRLLGRGHSAQDAVDAYARAREAGFANVTLDLIYGAPGQDLGAAREDAARAAALGPEHLSCYALTLGEGPLAIEVPMEVAVRQGRLKVPDEDQQWEMAGALREVLSAAGYHRYEISNWARPGLEARHNSLYWTGGEYLGLGCGACGFALHDPSDPKRGGRRWGNYRSSGRYLAAVEAGELPEEWSEELRGEDLLRERIVMGLRLMRGVDLLAACAACGQDPAPVLANAAPLVERGLARLERGVLALTEAGLDFHSEVAMRFV